MSPETIEIIITEASNSYNFIIQELVGNITLSYHVTGLVKILIFIIHTVIETKRLQPNSMVPDKINVRSTEKHTIQQEMVVFKYHLGIFNRRFTT